VEKIAIAKINPLKSSQLIKYELNELVPEAYISLSAINCKMIDV
jgi:hypothetical protein